MPELPEVESIRVTLQQQLVAACDMRVTAASLNHPEILWHHQTGKAVKPGSPGARLALLHLGVIRACHRHGKQLAIQAKDGRVLLIQLGMSGRLQLTSDDSDQAGTFERPKHAHVEWEIRGRSGRRRLLFIDPRRFGHLTAFDSMHDLRLHQQTTLGPDALSITGRDLAGRCAGSQRSIKSLLLDQSVVAGIGNIYADEILHRAGLHPLIAATAVVPHADRLSGCIRRVLERAVALGGSSIRDYRDPGGQFGSFQREHRVYGQVGRPCRTRACRSTIEQIRLAGRSTSFCPRCQPLACRR